MTNKSTQNEQAISFDLNKARLNAEVQSRLYYLKKQIEKECISYGEIAELQSLADWINPSDTLLLEWAGVPENQDFNKTHTLEEIKEARQAVKDSN